MPLREKVAELWTKIALFVSTGTAAIGTLTLNEWAAIVGIVSTIAVTGYSVYCKRKHLQIAQELAKQNRMSCVTCDKVQPND